MVHSIKPVAGAYSISHIEAAAQATFGMFKRALFLSLLSALALASPVTQSGVAKRDDRTYSGTATIYVTPLNACEIDTDNIVAFVGVGDDVYDEGDACGDM